MDAISIKKIFKIFRASFLGIFLPYLMLFTVIFWHGSVPLLGFGLENFITETVLILTASLIFSLMILIFIYLLSLLNKKIFNDYFAFIFSVYSFLIVCLSYFFIIRNLLFLNIFWYLLMLIFIPLIGVIVTKDKFKL